MPFAPTFGLWPPHIPLTLASTAGSHRHVPEQQCWLLILHLTGLGWPNRPGPVVQNPRVQVQEDCSLSGRAARPQSWASGQESRGRAPHTRCWACCPGTSLNQEGSSPRLAPSQTSPGLLPSPRAQHSHRIRLLRLSILQNPGMSKECRRGTRKENTRRSELWPCTLKFPL